MSVMKFVKGSLDDLEPEALVFAKTTDAINGTVISGYITFDKEQMISRSRELKIPSKTLDEILDKHSEVRTTLSTIFPPDVFENTLYALQFSRFTEEELVSLPISTVIFAGIFEKDYEVNLGLEKAVEYYKSEAMRRIHAGRMSKRMLKTHADFTGDSIGFMRYLDEKLVNRMILAHLSGDYVIYESFRRQLCNFAEGSAWSQYVPSMCSAIEGINKSKPNLGLVDKYLSVISEIHNDRK